MQKLICKKNWYLNGKLGYKVNEEYNVLEKEVNNRANCALIKSNKIDFKGWFWSDSEYFDVDILFKEGVI